MHILFDLDDTLHDKRASLAKCGSRLVAEFQLEKYLELSDFIERFIYENTIIQPKSLVFKALSEKFGFSTKLESQLLEAFDHTFHADAVPFQDAKAVLDFLTSQDVLIGCVTNGRDFFQRNKISALGFTEYFDSIVTSGQLGIKKPDHRIFQLALSELGIRPYEAAFCGDSLRSDMMPSKALGLVTIWKSSERVVPDSVDYVLADFSCFLDIWSALTNRSK